MPKLHDTGEEYVLKNGAEGTFDILLYNTSDNLADGDDVSAITTEPGGSNYLRQSDTFSTEDASGDWQVTNDSKVTFDTSDSTVSVDGYAIVVNFTSSDTGDSSDNDHLLSSGNLSKSYNLDDGTTNIEAIDIELGSAGVSIT